LLCHQGLFSARTSPTILYATWLPIGVSAATSWWTVRCSTKPFRLVVIDALPAIVSRYGPPQPATHRYRRPLGRPSPSASEQPLLAARRSPYPDGFPTTPARFSFPALVNPLTAAVSVFRSFATFANRQSRRRGGSARLWRSASFGASSPRYSTPSRSAAALTLSGLIGGGHSRHHVGGRRPFDQDPADKRHVLAAQFWSSSRWLAPARWCRGHHWGMFRSSPPQRLGGGPVSSARCKTC